MPSGVGEDSCVSRTVVSGGCPDSTCGSGALRLASRRRASLSSTRWMSRSRTSGSSASLQCACHDASSPAAVRPTMGIDDGVRANG